MIFDRDDEGRVVSMAHEYYEPTPAQLIEYHRLLSRVKRDEAGQEQRDGNLLEARLYLWRACIHRAGGYEFDGADLMTRENWKDLVPARHQVEAAQVMEPDYSAARLPKPEADGKSPFTPRPGSGSPEPETATAPESSGVPST